MHQILVIDDDTVSQQFLVMVLQRLGYENVVVASDGLDALIQLDAGDRHFDVIFCDLDMPRMDGIEFVRHLGERAFQGMLLISSSFDERVMESVAELARMYDLWLAGVLPKPINHQTLQSLINQPPPASRHIPSVVSPPTEEELRAAIGKGELRPFLQPQVAMEGGQIRSAEVLARWQHPRLGLIGPQQFIQLAENSSLITELTLQMLRQAAVIMDRLPSETPLAMSLNLSVESLNEIALVSRFERILNDCGFPFSRLIVEVTETGLMANPTRALELLTRLRLKGARLSIDDFGTGFASMDRLSRIPFTELKIDKGFVIDAALNPTNFSIVRASAELGRQLGLDVVAEGVATESEWQLCRQLGVEIAQGSFISPPVDAESFRRWLLKHRGVFLHAAPNLSDTA
ncbi:EAL domain-containing response regulator [Chromobacterium piscinae]|uniref:EAL domain-containing response regulator n=1 Tax=Chromobacterium piscinae TaxID=686831 RepID=A0ABV0H3M8_9NEIS|nr:EAL domain-containing response regulator [Chromobacterium piscinae]MCD5328235.1 EAL domain-containing response regulator [Chromobacterium piscinae]NHQ83271.1 EAL domain-containing response regulator [Chromobacterium vaccinii]